MRFPFSQCKNGFVFLSIVFVLPMMLTAQAPRPNIIYIMTDDLGYADLSGYGRKDYKTPNLDRLASQGMKFTNAYAAAPVCTPTRTAFMTGRYPARTAVGVREPLEWSAKDSLVGLLPETPTIATSLQKAGYATFLVGKWHLGFGEAATPRKNGFDYFYGFKGGGVDYISHRSPRGGPHDFFENETPVYKEGYMTDLLVQKAIDLISTPQSKPFFLALMFNAPHWPWQVPGDAPYHDTMPWTGGGSPSTYAAMMQSLDAAVAKLMAALDERKLSENTIVIFTSDNGGERFSDMSPYKGRKMQLWEGGIRVPAFVRWTGKISPNSTTEQVATTMDWSATILSLAGAKQNADFPSDGMDLSKVLLNQQKVKDRTLYWRIYQRIDHKAMRDGKWKYLRDEKGNEYLFDLSIDPTEKNDLHEKEEVVFRKLKEQYAAWETTVLKPFR